MSITRVKICGITRPEDAAHAAELGADAIGLNFVGGPRQISLQRAFEIARRLPPVLNLVALATSQPRQFPNALTPLQIGEFRPRLPIHTFQMYGGNESEFIDSTYYSFYWVVASITNQRSLRNVLISVVTKYHDLPAALLLDTASEKLGGTGQSFNWNWIAEARAAGELEGLPPIILAGGLTPDNVADAVRIARPYAVDVSSGVEIPGKPGIKDPIKMRDFIQAAKGV
jgi:phosphoribosylanthranilate isomerase